MARQRSPEKRQAILDAAVEEIAVSGLSAATAQIARRAGIASGSLFIYFATKEELLNELYLTLKAEVYARINTGFPHKGSLERRCWHIWSNYLAWAVESPQRRKVSMQLFLCDIITGPTRAKTDAPRALIDSTLKELNTRTALAGLPSGFAAATMSAMQDATLEFITRKPTQRDALSERAFAIFWRAVK